VLVGGGAAIASLVVTHQASDHAIQWIAIPAGIAFFGCALASFIPQKASLEIDGNELRPSWRASFRAGPPALGSFVMAAIDTPVGMYLRAGPVKLGARDHDGEGYTCAAPPSRSVDFEMSIADFDQVCAQLAVPRAREVDAYPIELVRNGQSGAGVFRMMAPWLATMVLCSAIGAGAMTLGLGMIGTLIATVIVLIAGLVTTIVLSARPKRPVMVIVLRQDGLALSKIGGDELARAPWQAIRGAPRHLRIAAKGGPIIMPALALSIGGMRIELAVWDQVNAWPGKTPRAGGVWLIGAPQWRRLVTALRMHRAIDG
jgi:hypothetical protein